MFESTEGVNFKYRDADPFQNQGVHASDVSSDSSTEESYKEKFEHLKVLVSELHKQVKSEKIRNDGLKAVSSCLQEEREENTKLRNKVRTLANSVSTLQSRLTSVGGSTSLSIEEGEFVAPGTSKQLLENLIRENSRLKHTQQHSGADPERMEQLHKQLKEAQGQIQHLQEHIQKVSTENLSYKQTLSSSTCDKDVKIAQLEQFIQKLEQKKETQDILCQSLSEESVSLKQKLRETAEMCEHLATKMDEKPKYRTAGPPFPSGNISNSLQKMNLSSNSLLNPDTAALLGENEKLKSSIQEMQNQLKEVASMNSKWQGHHEEQQRKIQFFQTKLTETENQLARTQGSHISENQQKDIDRLLLASKRKVEQVEEEKQKIEDESRQLRMQNEQLKNAITKMQQEMQQQQQQQTRSHTGGDDGQMEALQMQIQTFSEDFQHERQDRERAQAKIADLEQENTIIKRQLEQFQTDHCRRLYEARQAAFQRMQNEQNYGAPGGLGYQPQRLVGRGLEMDCVEDDDPNDMVEQADNAVEDDGHDIGPDEIRNDNLRCPGCQKEFAPDKHTELLEHIDQCCD